MKTRDGERILEMMDKFGKLAHEDQVYLSGIVQGMYLQKEKRNAPSMLMKKNCKQEFQI